MIKKLWNTIKGFGKEGIFHIFGSSVLSQVGALISSMVVVRRLPKVDYGYYVGANNLYSYCAIFIGIGLAAAMLQFCSERITEEKKNSIYRYSIARGMLANVLVCFVILGLSLWKYLAGDAEVAYYLSIMSGLPFVVYINNYCQMVLRIKLKNKEYSFANIVYVIAMLAGNIIFTILFGISGLIIALYLSNLLSAIACLCFLRKDKMLFQLKNAEKLGRDAAKEIVSFALVYTLTNVATSLLVLLDVTCLDLVLGDVEILADYKVAATIPVACHFVPACLITFFYPKMVRSFSDGKAAGKAMTIQLLKIFFCVNALVSLCLVLGAPLIVRLIFGAKYSNVVPLFRVLSVNCICYSISSLLGNVFFVIKKVKTRLVFYVGAGLLNIGLNILLIYHFGSVGAAVATILAESLIITMEGLYLRRYFKKEA